MDRQSTFLLINTMSKSLIVRIAAIKTVKIAKESIMKRRPIIILKIQEKAVINFL